MRFKKSVLAGVLALGTMVGAGAASAAPYTYSVSGGNTVPFTVVYGSDAVKLANQYGIDLNALLQSIEKSAGSNFGWTGHYIQWPTGTNAGTGSGKVTKPSPAKPSQPTASQPPKSQPTANKPAAGSGSGAASQPSAGSGSTTSTSAFASQVVDLVNQERAKAGLKPLTADSALNKMALDKAKDMYANNYFDHTSPTYGSPFDMMKSYGISFTYAGENIAKGQRTPQEVMNAWMNSQGHRENILSPNYSKIGVAYYNGEWVQEFIAN